jgi:NADP-dependent 3-hydroxy acid dehydrogenase YdfG/acyl carrier protein
VSQPNPSAAPSWIAAFQESQRQLAEVHARFGQSMADTHMAFLRAQEVATQGLVAMVSGQTLPAVVPSPLVAAPISVAVPPVVMAPTAAPPVAHAPVAVAPVAVAPITLPPAAPFIARTAPRAVVAAPRPASSGSTAAAPARDLPAMLLAVVGEKTGYPAEMLRLDMNLEADLGIDSIKRVEILSALREKAPELPEPDAETLGRLHTLGQIVEVLGAQLPSPTVAAPASAPSPRAAAVAPSARDLPAMLLAVVGEKTGYPAEMLRLDMNLEADLGIDSIKRVEILSALRERAPELPEPDAETLGRLHTLAQIVEVLHPFVPAPPMRGGSSSARSEAAPPPLEPASGAALTRLDLALIPVPDTGARPLGAVVVTGEAVLADALCARLVAAGVDAIRGADAVPERGAVVCAPEADDDAVRRAFQAARTARLDASGAFVVVTRMGGDLGIAGPDNVVPAALVGLTKTVALEHPQAFVRAIDIAGDTPVEALTLELGRAGPVEIGLSNAGRRTLAAVPVPQPHLRPVLGPEDVVVVSGGARGVTAACVIELAARTQAKFALLGRSRIDAEEPPEARSAHDEAELMRALAKSAASPAALRKQVASILASREASATIQAVRAAGGQAVYLPVDVTDAAAVAAALVEVRTSLGPITGVVHGAGVIHDRRVKEKTDAQWDAVWATKIHGVRALLSATEGDALKAICFFSSVAARTGNVGQADYAAANELLNRLAAREARRRPGCVVRAIGWGPWEGGMVTPALARQFHARGIALIPLIEGARAFVDELAQPSPTEVVIGGLLAGDRSAVSLRRACARDYPFVRDHSVADAPVVPVVLALEWFAQRARELRPDAWVQAVSDLKVLKGIVLKEFDGAGDIFEIATVGEGPDGVQFELRSPGGPVHYRATVSMGAAPPSSPGQPERRALAQYPHSPAEVYSRYLFHGPDFQVLRAVRGLSSDAAEAELTGIHDAGWPTDGWVTDMAAGDGGLQLAVLWSRQAMKGASLPTAIQSYRPYGRPAAGPVRGVLKGRRLEGKRSVSDISLVDASGRVYADLLGVELTALPGGEYPGKPGDRTGS